MGIVVLGRLGEGEFQVSQQLIVIGEERQIDLRVIQFSGMELHNGPKGGKEFCPTRGLACPARPA